MKKILGLSIFIPLFLTQASFWSFWNRSYRQPIKISRNYDITNSNYMDYRPAQFLKQQKDYQNFELYFHAKWCASCHVMDNQLQKRVLQLPAKVLKVDFDRSSQLRRKYGVVVPSTFIFFRKGKAVRRSVNPDFEVIVQALR